MINILKPQPRLEGLQVKESTNNYFICIDEGLIDYVQNSMKERNKKNNGTAESADQFDQEIGEKHHTGIW